VVEVDRQNGQESRHAPVLLSLQGVPEQDMLDEKLLNRVD